MFAKLAIKNNINLLIEKPLVLNIDNAKKLIKLSKSYKKCWIVFQNRYNKAINKLKKEISDQKKINLFMLMLKCFGIEIINIISLIGMESMPVMERLTNQAIHLIDTISYILEKLKLFNRY